MDVTRRLQSSALTRRSRYAAGYPGGAARAPRCVRGGADLPAARLMLAACLRALTEQDFPVDRYEIVVCDDGPDEATRACVAAHSAARAGERGLTLCAIVPVTSHARSAGARNAGWQQARSPVIAFTDDDTLPDPHWLLRRALRAIAPEARRPPRAESSCRCPPCRPTTKPMPAASNAPNSQPPTYSWRRSFLTMTGGFDETVYISVARGLRPAVRAAASGRQDRARRTRRSSCIRCGRRVGSQHFAAKKSQFDALLYKKHPELFKARIRSSPPSLAT